MGGAAAAIAIIVGHALARRMRSRRPLARHLERPPPVPSPPRLRRGGRGAQAVARIVEAQPGFAEAPVHYETKNQRRSPPSPREAAGRVRVGGAADTIAIIVGRALARRMRSRRPLARHLERPPPVPSPPLLRRGGRGAQAVVRIVEAQPGFAEAPVHYETKNQRRLPPSPREAAGRVRVGGAANTIALIVGRAPARRMRSRRPLAPHLERPPPVPSPPLLRRGGRGAPALARCATAARIVSTTPSRFSATS